MGSQLRSVLDVIVYY